MTDATELDEATIRRDAQVVRDHIPRGYNVAHRVADGALAALDEITRLRASLDEARAEVERLRETNGRLNRRAQTAESAINELAHGTGNGKARPVSAEIWTRCQEVRERHCPRATAAEAALKATEAERDELQARLTRRERQHADRLAEEASEGDTGICRTCASPITFATVEEPGYLPRTGWSDGARVDALVCFKAVDYRHVPLVGRERGIWDAATKAAEAALVAEQAKSARFAQRIASIATERDDARLAVERVRAVCDEPDDVQWWPVQPYMDPPDDDEVTEVRVLSVDRVLAALDAVEEATS